MKLTSILFKHKPLFVGLQPKFRGSALSGKHKFVPAADRRTRFMQWNEWKEQDRVLKYISKPYIDQDQELDYLESIGRRHHDVDPLYTAKIEAPMRQRYAINILEVMEKHRKQEEWE